MKFKRVICVVVLLSTLFSFSAFANENNNEDEKLVPVTKEVAAQMAMNWVRSIEPELQLSIGEIREIYDVTEHLIGYSVEYLKEENSYGYVILDFTLPDIIAEYSISPGQKDVYTQIMEYNPSPFLHSKKIDDKLYRVEPYTYAVETELEDQKLILDNEGTVRDEETFEEYKEAVVANTPSLFSVYDPSENMVMIDVSTAMRFYDVVSSNHFPSFFALDQYFSETLVKKYACSVQAAAINGILIYGLDPNGYANDYNAIWNCTGTTTYGVENGISYGTTEDGNLGRGFANFLMNYKGYSNITYSENVNPQLAFFKGAIDTSRVAAFSYRVNGANSGHTVAVEGYMDARVKGTGASVPFLMVADGWQEEVRYINLNYSSFARRRGIIWSGVKVSY